MANMITTYLVVVLLVSLGFFGVGALASATETRDPMQPPAFALEKFRQANRVANPPPETAAVGAPKAEPLRLDLQ
jgi:hypothetical protein